MCPKTFQLIHDFQFDSNVVWACRYQLSDSIFCVVTSMEFDACISIENRTNKQSFAIDFVEFIWLNLDIASKNAKYRNNWKVGLRTTHDVQCPFHVIYFIILNIT